MTDFHSHVLPGMDDGAEDPGMSLAMLRECARQGVRRVCATSHFYADEEDPASFLQRRAAAADTLRRAMEREGGTYPEVVLGAEVLYFPGMSVAEDLLGLVLEGTPFLLVEPPMMPWTGSMLNEIAACGENLGVLPVIAHVDRYMRLLRDSSLLEQVRRRHMPAQVNASWFLRRETRRAALDALRSGRVAFLGSDCHDMADRAPNLGPAAEWIRRSGGGEALDALMFHAAEAVNGVEL